MEVEKIIKILTEENPAPVKEKAIEELRKHIRTLEEKLKIYDRIIKIVVTENKFLKKKERRALK